MVSVTGRISVMPSAEHCTPGTAGQDTSPGDLRWLLAVGGELHAEQGQGDDGGEGHAPRRSRWIPGAMCEAPDAADKHWPSNSTIRRWAFDLTTTDFPVA